MKNILVLGARGQVGVEVCALMSAKGYQVSGFGSAELDVCDHMAVIKAVERLKINVVINCSAYTAVDKAEDEEDLAYQVNAVGPENLAFVSKQFDIPVIHISTDYVFDGSKIGAYVEHDETGPKNAYGRSKLSGEQLMTATCEKFVILRTSWVFGLAGANFVKTILRLAEDRDSLNIIGDQLGAPTYAGDIAVAILRIVEAVQVDENLWGIYHFSGDHVVSWAGFARQILSLRDGSEVVISEITTEEYGAPAPRPLNSEMSGEKILNAFGVAQSDWRLALPRFVKVGA